jgi:chemotaxis protein histidine kinase CheA
MNEQDEIIQDFVREIKTIHSELKKIINLQIQSQKINKQLFEQFGQFVDRIYGTATTLGYMEMGKYLFTIKSVSYLSSQCDREIGQKKALRMMIECVDNLEKICSSIHKKEEMKALNRMFLGEIAKGERMEKAEFQSITRKSVA